MKFDGFGYDSSGVSLVLRCVSFLFYYLLNCVELSLYMQSCLFYDSRLVLGLSLYLFYAELLAELSFALLILCIF